MLELIMFLMVIAIEIDTLVSGTKCTSNVNLSPRRALIDAQVLRQIISVCVSVRCVNCGHSCLRRNIQWSGKNITRIRIRGHSPNYTHYHKFVGI